MRFPSTPWDRYAACRSHPRPNIFFPKVPDGRLDDWSTREALRVCNGCDVQTDCLAYALDWEPYGIWGARTENERKAIKRRRRKVAA